MALAPNVENYTLGRGRLYFAPYDSDGNMGGERALGNAPAFNFTMAVEKLDHFSSMTGLKAKDKTVVTQITPSVSFTIDELSDENLNMLFYGSTATISQSADDANSTVITGVELDRWYDLGHRSVGIFSLVLSGVSGDWAVGDTVTGATSSDTCVIVKIQSATTFYVSTLGGTAPYFQTSETVSNGSTGTGTVVTIPTFISTNVSVSDGVSTYYTLGTDYTLDASGGRVFIKSGGSIVADDDITVEYAAAATTYTKLTGLSQTSLEGRLRFISDYPEGPNMTFTAWKVSLMPEGDTAFIGDDWSTIQFTGEILQDLTGHPTSPYLEIIM